MKIPIFLTKVQKRGLPAENGGVWFGYFLLQVLLTAEIDDG